MPSPPLENAHSPAPAPNAPPPEPPAPLAAAAPRKLAANAQPPAPPETPRPSPHATIIQNTAGIPSSRARQPTPPAPRNRCNNPPPSSSGPVPHLPTLTPSHYRAHAQQCAAMAPNPPATKPRHTHPCKSGTTAPAAQPSCNPPPGASPNPARQTQSPLHTANSRSSLHHQPDTKQQPPNVHQYSHQTHKPPKRHPVKSQRSPHKNTSPSTTCPAGVTHKSINRNASLTSTGKSPTTRYRHLTSRKNSQYASATGSIAPSLKRPPTPLSPTTNTHPQPENSQQQPLAAHTAAAADTPPVLAPPPDHTAAPPCHPLHTHLTSHRF